MQKAGVAPGSEPSGLPSLGMRGLFIVELYRFVRQISLFRGLRKHSEVNEETEWLQHFLFR